MEEVVLSLQRERGLSLGLAESLTGGLIASRLVAIPGASDVVRGSVVSYASDVKFDVLGVPVGPVVSDDAARAMSEGACRVLNADVGIAVTGVAGPEEQEGVPAGTVFMATTLDGVTETTMARFPFNREQTRQFTVISVLDHLRRRLIAR